MKYANIMWPCELPAPFKSLLLKSARTYVLDSTHQIDFGKDGTNGLFYVLEGLVIFGRKLSKKPSPFFVLRPGEWFGGLTIYRTPDLCFQIFSPDYSKVLYIPNEVIRDIAISHTEMYKFFYYLDFEHINETLEILWATVGMERTQRVAYILLKLSLKFPRVAGSCPMIALSQSVMAKMLGLSRTSLNQELKQLEEKHLISIGWKKIHILNVPILETLTDVSP